jgi:hypothetical protein
VTLNQGLIAALIALMGVILTFMLFVRAIALVFVGRLKGIDRRRGVLACCAMALLISAILLLACLWLNHEHMITYGSLVGAAGFFGMAVVLSVVLGATTFAVQRAGNPK